MKLANHKVLKPLAAAAAVALAFSAGYFLRPYINAEKKPHAQIRQEGYRYINPLLECEMPGHYTGEHPDLKHFRNSVQRVVESHISDGSARTIAFYFRDLRQGAWFGINEHEKFAPASLMKVPLMISLLKQVEHDDSLLKKKIPYKGGEDAHRFQHVRPKEVLQPGNSYTVDDLIHRMIAYSDNDAALLLTDTFGMAAVGQTAEEIGVQLEPGRMRDAVTLREFTAFFRVLYNASYLDDHMSERSLEYLSRSEFRRGIRAGLPVEVVVASKFGEFPADGNQLHEFGIVYYPDHPYLLGIVTKGGSPESLSHVLEEVSRTVYSEIQRQHSEAL